MKILVVGGTGFLGSEIVPKLASQGHLVRSLNRTFLPTLNLDQTLGDIEHPDSYLNLLNNWKPEVVIQTAWVTEQRSYRTSPRNASYAESSVVFARNCFETGVEHYIGLGSCAEYGDPKEPCNAVSTPAHALNPYGESKLQTLQQLQSLALDQGRRFTWARIFQPYGRNQDPERLIPFAARRLKAGENVSVAHPNTILDWITSRDIAAAISFTLANDLPQVIDVGTSIGTSIYDTLLQLAALLDVDPLLIRISRPTRDMQEPPDLVVSKLSPLLTTTWKPLDDLSSGLEWALSL